MNTIVLTDAQVDALADRIVARLKVRNALHTSPGLVDAATVARALGVARSWVYAHADELGGRRLGGPRGRLRFDLATAEAAFTTRACAPEPKDATTTPRRGKPASAPVGSILQVRE